MKRLFRVFGISILSLYLASQMAGGLQFENYTEGIIVTGLALGLANFTIKPIVKILLLPLTLATMGVFNFLINVVTLYIVDMALSKFTIVGFNFSGLSSTYLDIPAINYQGLMSYLAFGVLISILSSLLNWIAK